MIVVGLYSLCFLLFFQNKCRGESDVVISPNIHRTVVNRLALMLSARISGWVGSLIMLDEVFCMLYESIVLN